MSVNCVKSIRTVNLGHFLECVTKYIVDVKILKCYGTQKITCEKYHVLCLTDSKIKIVIDDFLVVKINIFLPNMTLVMIFY